MKSKWLMYFVLLISSIQSFAQTGTISATAVDTTGTVLANGTYAVNFIPTPGAAGPFTNNGAAFTKTFSGNLSSIGFFTITAVRNDAIQPANSKWEVVVCPDASSGCVTTTTSLTSGAVDVSATITTLLGAIKIFAAPMVRAYNNAEVTLTPNSGQTYYNTSTKQLRIWDKGLNTWIGFPSDAFVNIIDDYGAVGDCVADDTAAFNNGLAGVAASGRLLYLPKPPGGCYLITSTITFPVDGSKYARYSMVGEWEHEISSSSGMPGVVIQINTNTTAFQTARLTDVNNILANWTKNLYLANIYIKGPQTQGSATSASVGLDLLGTQFFKGNNIHVEGFGYGIKMKNGSEAYFEGRTMLQNNYYGFYAERISTSIGDLAAEIDNLMTVNNQVNVYLTKVRSVNIKSGENITYGTNCSPLCFANGNRPTPLPRFYVVGEGNTQVNISNYLGENDENIEFLNISGDVVGVGNVNITNSNFETLTSTTLVKTTAAFDTISITNSAFPRGTGSLAPLVNSAIVETTNGNGRANRVIVANNSPAWLDVAVKNQATSRSVYDDYIPYGFQQIRPRREMDELADNRTTGAGALNFTTNNVQAGKARLYFTSTAVNNFVTVLPTRAIKGATLIYATIVLDDRLGVTIPTIDAIAGIGVSPTDWQLMNTTKLATFTVGTRTFQKYLFTIAIINRTTSASTGITAIRFANLYGAASAEGGGVTDDMAGVSIISIYANTLETGEIFTNNRTMAAAPTTGLEGRCAVGDIIYHSTPVSAGYLGWVCITAGQPGTWKTFGNLSSDSINQNMSFNNLILGGGTAISKVLSATSVQDLGNIVANSCLDSTGITVTGAVDGDVVQVGVLAAVAATAGLQFTAYVSAADTVKVRACNETVAGIDPASTTYRVAVTRF